MPVWVWPHDQCLWPTLAHRQVLLVTSPVHVLGRGREGGREGEMEGRREGGRRRGRREGGREGGREEGGSREKKGGKYN